MVPDSQIAAFPGKINGQTQQEAASAPASQALEPAFKAVGIIESRPQVEINSPITVTPPSASFGQNIRTKTFFEATIAGAWQKTAQGIFDTGRWLLTAKDELDPEVFKALRLPFSLRTKQRLMTIAGNVVLATHVSQCPPHWGTLYALSRINDGMLLAKFRDNTISVGLERHEIRTKILSLPARRRMRSSKKNGQTETQFDPIAMWKAFSTADKRAILDSEGRSGLAKLLSADLMVDLVDRLIRQELIWASTKPKPAVVLTAILRATLDPALDRNVVFGRFEAKLASFGLDLHDIAVVLTKQGKKKR